jgi:formylglycine-generating enzyme required for sulfatase activity
VFPHTFILLLAAATAQAPSTASAPAIPWARIPAGSFEMGCVPGDPRCGVDEFPRHRVTFSRPFEMMITEVTVEMYRVAGLPLGEQPPWSTSPRHPVVIVTWDRAQQFCGTVGGRLPTEAEWEYAARGGREGSMYPWGDQPPTVDPGAVNGAAFENERPHPVQSFAPNAYGLYDMAGNVWEWTADAIGLYSADAVTDPQGPASGRARIVRGGSFGDDPENLRVSNRTPNQPGSVNVNVGLRCVRNVK